MKQMRFDVWEGERDVNPRPRCKTGTRGTLRVILI
jgi:hypothetical protein